MGRITIILQALDGRIYGVALCSAHNGTIIPAFSVTLGNNGPLLAPTHDTRDYKLIQKQIQHNRRKHCLPTPVAGFVAALRFMEGK